MNGAFMFFGIALASNIVAIIMFFYMKPWKTWPEAQRWTEAEINKSLVSEISLQPDSFVQPSIRVIHWKIWPVAYTLFFLFTLTNLTYPGLLLQAQISFISNIDWQVWFIIIVANASDFIGWIFNSYFPTFNKPFLLISPWVRILSVVVLFLSCFDVGIFETNTIKLINSIVFWFTHGYLGNALFMLSFKLVADDEIEVVGKFMSFMLVLGCVVGSFISAFGFTKINFN